MSRVDLVLSELHERDATSTHARFVRDLLVEDGHDVRFVAERSTIDGESFVHLDRWNADADLTVLQHSIGSVAASEIAKRRIPVVVNYHNITPLEFVEPWEPRQVEGLRWGRQQLWELRPVAVGAICDSDYNARELRDIGFRNVAVSPVLFDPLRGDAVEPAPFGGVTMLFVGRLSPNKCQHDLVAALAALRARGVPARLVLVGGDASAQFRRALDALAQRLGVADAVIIAGSVPPAELIGWYLAADVFVSTSEHEGFCVPAVEAMGLGVPVVAYGAAAIPETVGGAGIVLSDKSPGVIAEAVQRVASDDDVRAELIARGRGRAAELGEPSSIETMRDTLRSLLSGAAV
ncbi:MAG: glycosyltransferase family 4 protein [Actinomycetota bacterium]